MEDCWLFNADEQQKILEALSIEERAEKACLPDYLSIGEIVKIVLPYPPKDSDNAREWHKESRLIRDQRKALCNKLIQDCKDGKIQYKGDINGWEYSQSNPYPLARNGVFIPSGNVNPIGSYEWNKEFAGDCKIRYYDVFKCRPTDCTIHKDEFKQYLKSNGKWPAPGRLANWWLGEDADEVTMEKIPVTTEKNCYQDKNSVKSPQKQIKEKKRDTNFTLLIDELAKRYGVYNKNDLSGPAAWGKIVSGKFKSDLLESVSEGKTFITFTDGKKLAREQFIEMYRKRFE